MKRESDAGMLSRVKLTGEHSIDHLRHDTMLVAAWLRGVALALESYPEDDEERRSLDLACTLVGQAAKVLERDPVEVAVMAALDRVDIDEELRRNGAAQ